MIKHSSIQQVMDSMRVDEVLGDYIHLRRRGTNMISNCPFHDEKTPSFVVSPAKGMYKCFGCGKGGNGLTFLMEHENMPYVDAIRHLAKKYNITLEETKATEEELEKIHAKDSLLIINEFVNKIFQKNLTETEDGRMIGLSYYKERGFNEETIEEFQLGYCRNTDDELYKELIKAGYKQEYISQLGLAKEYDGRWRDFYRGRVIFPIQNLTGRVVGFGGRALGNTDKVAKYLNSPENEIYHKSSILYGMYQAKKSIPKENYCILVEGYTDVISLYQGGVENAVAPCGTAFTVEQLKLIRRFTENLVFLFDGDNAGIKASLKGMDMAVEAGLNVNLVLLDGKHDPDSYVREYGGEALKEYIKTNSNDIVTFKAKLYRDEAGKDPLKKAELTKKIIETISLVSDNIKKSFYIKECSILMGIDEELLNRETQRLINDRKKKQQFDKTRERSFEPLPSDIEISNLAEEVKQIEDNHSHLVTIEREVCKVLIEHGDQLIEPEREDNNPFYQEEFVAKYLFEKIWDEFEFESQLCKKIFDLIKTNYLENKIFPSTYYINHTDFEVSNFAINCSTHYNEMLFDWNRENAVNDPDNKAKSMHKKTVPVVVKQYGENYRKEVDSIALQVKLLYFEKMSKQLNDMMLAALGDTKELTDEAIQRLTFQHVFLEKYKSEFKEEKTIFRNLVR